MQTKKLSSIVMSIIITLLGMVLFIWPGGTLNVICWVIGLSLLLAAAFGFFFAWRGRESKGYMIGCISGALVSLIAGAIFLANPDFIISLIPILAGVGLLVNGFINLMQTMEIKRAGGSWITSCILAVLTITFGVLIFANPFATMDVLVKAIGVMLMYNGISNIYTTIKVR